jgi:hypothetical protein
VAVVARIAVINTIMSAKLVTFRTSGPLTFERRKSHEPIIATERGTKSLRRRTNIRTGGTRVIKD